MDMQFGEAMRTSRLWCLAVLFSILCHAFFFYLLCNLNSVGPSGEAAKSLSINLLRQPQEAKINSSNSAKLNKELTKQAREPKENVNLSLNVQEPRISELEDSLPAQHKQPPKNNDGALYEAMARQIEQAEPESDQKKPVYTGPGIVFSSKMQQSIAEASKRAGTYLQSAQVFVTYTDVNGSEVLQKGKRCFYLKKGHDETNLSYWSLPVDCKGSRSDSDLIQQALQEALRQID
ncbi:hypothetical protein SAMN02745866_02284 [Alteromonadaceae bacterium Bs31]|nr:hypothetical protein SAMN02745866_02284 [Alteromonadaceae bacterium Bs31]